MKKRYENGGEVDALEAANASEEAQEIADSLKRGAPGTSETITPSKPAAKATPKAAPKPTPMVGKGRREDGPPVGNAKRDFERSQDAKQPAKYESAYDRMNRTNREAGVDFDSMIGKLKKRLSGASDSGQDRILTGIKKKADENKFMGSTKMKSGGSVKPSSMGAVKQAKPSYGSASSRADGIATKGKTRGRYI
jgi:hypothetical protein